MDVAHQASLSMGFSRQEYWSRLPFPSTGYLPDPGIKPGLLPCRQILYRLISHQGIALIYLQLYISVASSWDYSSKSFCV